MRVKRTFTFNGKRYYADGATALEAEQARERMKMELKMGLRADGGMTVSQLADLYMDMIEKSRRGLSEKTLKQKRSLIDRIIKPALGSMPAKAVTQIHIMILLNELSDKYTQKHVDKVVTLLKGIFSLGLATMQCTVHPGLNLERPQGRSESPRREATSLERELYLGHLIWLDMVILCGLRPGETAQVRYCDVGEGVLYVDGTKNKNAKRYVPLPDWLRDRILAQPHDFDGEYVCRMRDNMRSRQWLRLVKKIPLPASDLEPYCFRHSYVTDLENCPGLSQAAIKRTVGHSVEGVTDRYTHSREETARKMLPELLAYWGSEELFAPVVANATKKSANR